jgi:hypothetical protein
VTPRKPYTPAGYEHRPREAARLGFAPTTSLDDYRAAKRDEADAKRRAYNALSVMFRDALRASPTDDGQPCQPGGETLLDRAMRDA